MNKRIKGNVNKLCKSVMDSGKIYSTSTLIPLFGSTRLDIITSLSAYDYYGLTVGNLFLPYYFFIILDSSGKTVYVVYLWSTILSMYVCAKL